VRRSGGGRKVPAGVALAIVLGVGAVVLVATQAGRSAQTEAVMQTGDDGAAVAGRVATGPARVGEGFFDRLLGGWNSAARIEQLEAENRELQAWRDLAERLAERNGRYESLLRMPPDTFGEGADVERSIAAQLVLDSGGPFMRTLVANAGELHGVKVGYIAVNEHGLVGRVVSVGQHSSRVLMLDDYNSRIPVMGEASRVRAVLAGQAMRRPELSLYPYQLEAPRMDFIVGAQSLREGERVITSGDGGLYPRGIQVGVARRERNGAWRVALSASQQPIDFVRIIPFVPIEAPETTADPNATPPLGSSSSVAVIGREIMAPPPSAPSAVPAPRPAQQRRQTAQNEPVAAQTPPPAQPQPEAPPPTEPPATPPQ
jgi:rod shape-determining protein MreC